MNPLRLLKFKTALAFDLRADYDWSVYARVSI